MIVKMCNFVLDFVLKMCLLIGGRYEKFYYV